MLKPMCFPQMARAPKVPRLREIRSLTLTISEAHKLPFKLVPNPYCVISLNQVTLTRVNVKSGVCRKKTRCCSFLKVFVIADEPSREVVLLYFCLSVYFTHKRGC